MKKKPISPKYLFLGFIFLTIHLSCFAFSLEPYKDFRDSWRVVTVRYRSDNGEQRFVYGNPSAVTALHSGVIDYPDGAVFTKIAYGLENDPDFVSSLMPSRPLRIQYMIRDRKKFKKTGGWGFFVTTGNGEPTGPAENPEDLQKTCFSCHEIVKDKGFVFSVFPPAKDLNLSKKKAKLTKLFKTLKFEDLPPVIKSRLKGVTELSELQGVEKTNVFSGTLIELRPMLIEQVHQTGQPAIFISTDKRYIAAIIPEEKSLQKAPENCSKSSHRLRSLTALPEFGLKEGLIDGWVCPD